MRFTGLRTERLRLRPMRADDAEALAARRSDPEVARYQNWTAPYSAERARTLVDEIVAMEGPSSTVRSSRVSPGCSAK